MTAPCQCPDAEAARQCRRAGVPMVGGLHADCRRSEAHRAAWDAAYAGVPFDRRFPGVRPALPLLSPGLAPASPHHPGGDDAVSAGVAVGSYGWPRLAELQVRLIRETCGPVPVLIVNDRPEGQAELQAI